MIEWKMAGGAWDGGTETGELEGKREEPDHLQVRLVWHIMLECAGQKKG